MINHPLIFLCGMPRSGTTWLAKIFDSHPDTLYRHEPDSQQYPDTIPLMPTLIDLEIYRHDIEAFVADLPNVRLTKVAASMPIFQKNYFSPYIFLLYQVSSIIAKAGSQILGELQIPRYVDFEKINQLNIVWKSIESLGRFGVVSRLIDNSYSIHIIRHPCGYVSSVLHGEVLKRFESKISSSEDYGIFEILLETEQAKKYQLDFELIKHMHPVERLAWRWVLFNEKAMDETEGLKRCTVVRYEDICQEPLEQSRKLFEFTELPWHVQTENFIAQSTNNEKSTYYSIIKNPIHSANKWKNELSLDNIDRILRITEISKPGKYYLS